MRNSIMRRILLLGTLALSWSSGIGVVAGAEARHPLIKKLGTIDCDLVETTPIVFKGRLYRFESVRENYSANKTGASCFRLIDVATGQTTPSFARGFHLGCALVEGDTVYVYGVSKWGGSSITLFRSKNLQSWQAQSALQLPGWELYNTSVCKALDGYTMAIEVGGPRTLVGVPFTNFFARSGDLLHWEMLPKDCVYAKEKYTACPALRFVEGRYYMVYLEARPGPTYESHIVRSPDLKHWESSTLNPVLRHSPQDKVCAGARLTPQQRFAISGARDINNSDMDFCDFQGKTVIYYSWGNQQGKEFLAEAVYDGPSARFLTGFFPGSR